MATGQSGARRPAGQAAGRCLRAGTASLNGNGRTVTRIEERQVGEGVFTHRGARSELAELIKRNPEQWKVLRARLEERDENAIEVNLLRHVTELATQKAVPGGMVYLDLPEMGACGWARVLGIDPCPEPIETEGKLVTGTFKHERGIIVEVHIEGEPNPIGITPGHMIWSADQQDWVRVQELQEGEGLLAMDGQTPRIECIALCTTPELVYNIEVERDHCYRVGEQGLLVHNASVYEVRITQGNRTANALMEDFARGASIDRREKTRHPLRRGNLDKGWANLGAAVYRVSQDGTTFETRRFRPTAGTFITNIHPDYSPQGGNASDGHTEQQLFIAVRSLVRSARCAYIVEIFSERSPCTGCRAYFQTDEAKELIGPDGLTVFYVSVWQSGETQSGLHLWEAYRDLGFVTETDSRGPIIFRQDPPPVS